MEQAGYSPGFKKPADIIRMRRKRARSEGVDRGSPSSRCPTVPGTRPFSPGPLLNHPNRPSGGVKRRNPFANIENTYNSPKKRATDKSDGDVGDFLTFKKQVPVPVVDNEGENSIEYAHKTSLSCIDLLVEDKSKANLLKPPVTPCEDSLLIEEGFPGSEKPTALIKSPQPLAAVEAVPPATECAEYPADWSLKTRLLFTSSHPFAWAEQPKAQEEALGLTQHCRAKYANLPQTVQDPRSCPELRCGLQQALQYWQHPSLPWLPLFPRIGAERKFAGKSCPWSQDSEIQQSMMREWSVSLTSLYSLLKARLCPYFYLCSYQFTVLFRVTGLSGTSGLTALLSPTTRGLREAMKADGIEFTMPLLEERRRSKELAEQAGPDDDDDSPNMASAEHEEKDGGSAVEEEEEEDDDEDGGYSWLKEMGVQDKIKKPDSITIKLRKERSAVCLDHKPESVVLVEGAHTHTLINFLINCKSLVAAAGSQAGLPPTLLAPCAFRGATLHSLKARSVNVKTQVRTTYQDLCSLEVMGPIMPHSLHMLTQLLRAAQKGSFSAGLYTHEPTAVLNVPVCKSTAKKEEEALLGVSGALSSCGLSQATVQQMMEPPTLGKSALRHLHMRGYAYTWKN